MRVTRGPNREVGLTLPELLVAMSLAAVVTMLLLLAIVTISRSQRFTEQDSSTLASLRTAVDRVERDVRQARKIYTPASPASVASVWVDADRDFEEDPEERIIWTLATSGGETTLTRTTGAVATPSVTVRDLIQSDWFSFNDEGTVATIALQADSEGALGPSRSVSTDVRLRNAQTR